MDLFNPWLWLGLVLALLAAGSGGAYLGYQYRDGEAARELHDTAVAVVDAARASAAAETRSAVRRATARAAAEARVREAKLKGDLDAARQNRPECARDDESMRVLYDLIDAANGAPRAAGGLSSTLPGDRAAGGRPGGDAAAVGERAGGAVRELSP